MKFGYETEKIEYKKSTGELKEAIISISSILNKHNEGQVYFGIKPNGTIIKNEISEKTLRDISKTISENIKPTIVPIIQIINVDGIDIIEVVFSGQEMPYSAYGRYYVRTADEDRLLSPRELERIISDKNYSRTWELMKTEYTIDDIDKDAFKNFYAEAIKSGRLVENNYNLENILRKLQLLDGDKLTNAGYYLFAKNKPVELKMGIFATDEKLNFLDIKSSRDNIYNLIKEAQLYVGRNMRWEGKIENSLRIEKPEIPTEALREVIVNGFAHAQYGSNMNHELDIFPSNISFFSPGEYISGFAPDEYIQQNVPSVIRNKIITRVLYMCRALEQFGSGFKRINQFCKDNNVDFTYENSKAGFTFIFNRIIKNQVENKELEKSDLSLSQIELMVLEFIKINPEITQKDIALKISKDIRTVKRVMSKLKDLNYIEREGSDKLGYWKIKI